MLRQRARRGAINFGWQTFGAATVTGRTIAAVDVEPTHRRDRPRVMKTRALSVRVFHVRLTVFEH
jgi:hypothetical protein